MFTAAVPLALAPREQLPRGPLHTSGPQSPAWAVYALTLRARSSHASPVSTDLVPCRVLPAVSLPVVFSITWAKAVSLLSTGSGSAHILFVKPN